MLMNVSEAKRGMIVLIDENDTGHAIIFKDKSFMNKIIKLLQESEEFDKYNNIAVSTIPHVTFTV